MQIMYHKTDKEHLMSILKDGLLPRKPDYPHIKDHTLYPEGVYLTLKPQCPCIDSPELEIDTTHLVIIEDPDTIHNSSCFYTPNKIRPERILKILLK